ASRRSSGGDPGLDVVPAVLEERRDVRGMARRAAQVRRPDAGDDENLHGRAGPMSTTGDGGPTSSGRMRAKRTAHTAANAHMPARTAPAAPVAPQRAPNTSTSGSTTAVSML